MTCFMSYEMRKICTGLFGVPGESLFVKVDDQLRTLLACELRWDQHGLVAVLPLNQKCELAFYVSGADDLLRFEATVEWRLVLAALFLRIVFVLFVGMLGFIVVIALLATRRFIFLRLLSFFFFFFFLGRLGVIFRIGFRLAFLVRILSWWIIVLLGAYGGSLVGTVADATFFTRAVGSCFFRLKIHQQNWISKTIP